MRRREFIAGAVALVAVPRMAAAGDSRRLAIFSPSEPSALMNEQSDNRYYRALFAELRRLGHVEGQNLVVERLRARAQRFGACSVGSGSRPQ